MHSQIKQIISSRYIIPLSSYLRLGFPKDLIPVGISFKIFENPPKSIFLNSGYMTCPSQSSRFNHPDYITLTVGTMKLFIVDHFPLPKLIPNKPKYSTQDPIFKHP